jgi:hypothetical protein
MYYALSMMFYAMQQDRAMKRREQALEYLCVGGGRDGVGGGGNGVGGESAELKAKLAEMQRKMEQMSQMHHDKRQQEQVIFFYTQNMLRQQESFSKTQPEI